MEAAVAHEYVNAMVAIKAQETLDKFMESVYPMAKKNKRKELWNKYEKMAKPVVAKEELLSSEEVAKALSRIV